MKECPICKELLGENVDTCFNCGYSYVLRRIPTKDEASNARKSKEREIEKLQESRQKMIEAQHAAYLEKEAVLQDNPFYEYAVETIFDNRDGSANVNSLKAVLDRYAMEGWRLHSIISNELGKNSSSFGVGGISSGSNATIDQQVLIFERCIKKGNL